MPTDLQTSIQSALQAIPTSDFRSGHLDLLRALGYASEKTMAIPDANPARFVEMAEANTGTQLHPEKARLAEWTRADILFQLTDDELGGQSSLFDASELKPGLLQSYLFFAIELSGSDYSRTALSDITRQINRLFPMPVMVLFTYNGTLSIAVINRRVNKREQHKDVLGKVTLIHGIRLAAPHRGHLEILESFSVPALTTGRQVVDSFDSLHTAWEAIFNVELLNKKFYRELSNWYFWAMRHCHFPYLNPETDKYDLFKDKDKVREHDAKNLIRLLTRILFVWFIKQKGLVPDSFFDPASLEKELLKTFDPESTETHYYKAVLQNLFFATLNQTHGKREFRKPGQHHNTTTLLRYEDRLKHPEQFIATVEATTPFLNGGLFDCLDYPHPTRTGPQGGAVTVYEDGFSDRKDNPLKVPDFLFFGPPQEVDLSDDYGDTKRKKEKVRGLIHILDGYKFTIVENTPIEQEIALDPELLGQVFENLLASYNEETKTTARKQTGSFYTPRPIVDYMVDESLKAHLEKKVAETILSRPTSVNRESGLPPSEGNTEAGLPLLPYNPNAPTHKTQANLPHWTQEGTTYWITFRLADSLPQEKISAWKSERDAWLQSHPEPWDEAEWKDYDERFGKRLEAWLDAGSGQCHLRRPEIRAIVEKCLIHFDGIRYDLGPWVIMPNHVHLLIRPKEGQALSKILQGIKGVSAKECNALLGQTGKSFWQEESFDHIVRSQAQFDRFVRYIAENPIKAKLREGDYQCSSDNPVAVPLSSIPETGLKESGSDNPVADFSMSETGLSRLRSNLDDLFAYNDKPNPFNEVETDALIRAIDNCKILDPACGSGAFPMGVLQKLVYVLGKLDPRDELWEKRQLAKVDKLIEAAQDFDDASFRERAIADAEAQRKDIEEAFANNELGYGRKLYLIENCLYGVDIQSIATQVSKLRFFISLIVDQTVKRSSDNPVAEKKRSSDNPVADPSHNFGIRPLPNLETKFVTADTLIQIEKPKAQGELFEIAEVSELQKQLKQVRHDLFSAKTPRTKRKHRERDEELRAAIAQELKQNGWASDAADKLAAWDPYDQNASAPYFDPEWMFGLAGFDVVIGNPPYVQIQKFPKAQKDRWVAQDFQTYAATADIYCLFYERGAQLLKDGGSLVYITSNKWMRAGYGEKLRKFLSSNVTVNELLDFWGILVFQAATVDTNILRYTKIPAKSNEFSSTMIPKDFNFSITLEDYVAEHSTPFIAPINPAENWAVLSPERLRIRKLVEAQGIPLKKWDIIINYGVKTGLNDAFYVTSKQRDALVAEDPACEKLIVPLLRGRFIDKYGTNWEGEHLINTHNGVKSSGIPPIKVREDYPAIWRHLSKWESKLCTRQDKGDHWSNLRNCAYLEDFSKPKIIYPEITKRLGFYYDKNHGFIPNNKGYIVTSPTPHLPYLTAFLNSSLFKCCYKDNFPTQGEDRRELRTIFFELLHVKKPNKFETELFEKLVPLIQLAKDEKQQATYQFLEALIDACVMECYFREHMAERDLLFQDAVAAQLQDYAPEADTAIQTTYLEALHTRLQATNLPQKLQVIPEKSPDLLGVILKEGKV